MIRELVAFALCVVAVPAQAGPAAGGSARVERLKQVLREQVEARRCAGATCSVLVGGRTLQATAGSIHLARGKPARVHSLFEVGALARPLTVAAALLLVDEGRLALDDPVVKYLPGFGDVKVRGTEEQDPVRPMTVRHLITHTSGVPPSSGAAGAVPDALRFAPGTRWHNGGSYGVLVRVLEAAHGDRLHLLIQRRILRPLGMRSSGFVVWPVNLPRRSRLYNLSRRGEFEEARQDDPTKVPHQITGDGGFYTSAGDYLRFARMLLNDGELEGKRILSVESARAIGTPQSFDFDLPAAFGALRLGLGVFVVEQAADGLRAGSFFLGSENGCFFWVDRSRGQAGVYLTNTTASPGLGRDVVVAVGG